MFIGVLFPCWLSRYLELDRRLVITDALIIPLCYRFSNLVVQPRVQVYPLLPVSHIPLQDVMLDD